MNSLFDRTRIAALQRPEGAERQWYSIKNANGVAELYVYDEIGYWGVTASAFIDEIRALGVQQINVRINSPGGDVADGIAIFNALRNHPAKVTTTVDSAAYSAASVIAQAGDHRIMVRHAQMMIHEASGVTMGNAEDARKFADVLDLHSDNIASIYAERADNGTTAKKFRQLMKAETWLSDSEAVELGLADEVVTPATTNHTTNVVGSDSQDEPPRFDWAAVIAQGIQLAEQEQYA
jgi:ATP-dependent protease ClpP protease subunit